MRWCLSSLGGQRVVLKSHFEGGEFIMHNFALSPLVHPSRQSLASRDNHAYNSIIFLVRAVYPLVIALFDECDHASQCTLVVYNTV